MSRPPRFLAAFAALLLSAGVSFVLARRLGSPPNRGIAEHEKDEGHGHASRPVPPPVPPAALLDRLLFNGASPLARSVRLFGRIETPGDAVPPQGIEESGTWPDRWERRVAIPGDVAWLRLEGGRLSRSPHGDVPGTGLSADQARLRLRALFCLRHLADVASGGGPGSPFVLKIEPMTSFPVEDGGGPFRLLVGGIAGGLRGIDSATGRVLFTAHMRTGDWFYPAAQSLLVGDRIVEVVRVVRTEVHT